LSKLWKHVLASVLFWAIFLVLFAYAQDVIVPKNSTTKTARLFNNLITPYTNATRTRAFEELPRDTVDLALVGSSTVFCSVSPAQLYRDHGVAAHDYAVGAITGALTDYLCDIVFETQSPRYVLLDATRLYADYLNNSVNYLLPFTRLTPSKVRVAADMGDLTAFVDNLVPLMGTHQNWYNVTPSDFAFTFSTREDPLLGMVGMVVPAADAQALLARYEKPAMSYATYTPPVKPALSELGKQQTLAFRDKCLAHGAKPMLMVCPSVFGNEATGFLLDLAAFAQANGIPMVNFNIQRQGLVLAPEDFADDHHLTMSGAEKFTAVFGDYLSQNLDLPDRRGDAAYARYDSSVAQYEAALAKLASVQEVAP